ncbi:Oligosaccharide translocation protein rft1 [Entomophthora muscae]|uniref:Oligosaccharide translocation protein rft1 n=1 Tax=Entomophthora muscae TaxID=34485 RepID=A0ACC2THF3_9FUNG|nr:Oligosaccharide translocation protein rft1 [Entomophthora muscae]
MAHSKKSVNDVLSSSISGASYLISLQLFSRVLTFVLNQLVVKIVGSKIYGAAMVDFELLLSTILFLSREGFRCALLRADVENSVTTEQSSMTSRQSNLAYLPIPIGLLISAILIFFHFSGKTDDGDVPYYYVSASLYIGAAMIELLSEPFYILNLSQLNYPLRFKIEASAVFLKCLFTFVLSFGLFHVFGEASSEYAILSFGVSQLIYSLVLLSGYLRFFISKEQSLFPRIEAGATGWKDSFDVELLSLSLTLSLQSFVKHLLTEGDKLLLALLNSAGAEKGRYSIAAHYGSLVARILFQPIEESGRGLFSKLLKDYKNDASSSKEDLDPVVAASNILGTILKFHVLLGFVFICFAPHYTATLFDLLLGPSWSKTNAPAILSIYCFYVPIMGINGITEAFVQAVAQPKELQSLSYAMTLFTAIFLGVGFVLVRILPSVAYAVIIANCLNLSLRIIWSMNYMVHYFSRFSTKAAAPIFKPSLVVPSGRIIIAFILSSALCNYSEGYFGFETLLGKIKHVLVGGICFIGVCGITFSDERKFLQDLKQLVGRPPKQTKVE